MKTGRRVWLIVLTVLIVASTVAVVVFHRSEPEYSGKPLSHWLAKLSEDPPHDPPVPEAEFAVRTIGTNALPFLLRSLTAEDSRMKRMLIRFDKSQTGIDLGLKAADTKANEALAGYMALAEIAEPAVPDLFALVNGPNEHAADIEMVLPYLGSAGIEATAKLLSSTNATTRQSAVINLAMPVSVSFGENQHRYMRFTERYLQHVDFEVPRLIGLLKDGDTDVAHAATFALGWLRLRPLEVLPALTNLAANEAAPLKARVGAIVAVGRFGKTAEPVTSFLQTLMTDANSGIRIAATNALRRVRGGSSDIIESK